MTPRARALFALCVGLAACDGPRPGSGFLVVRIGERTFYGEPALFELPPGDRVALTWSGCTFAGTRTDGRAESAAYQIELARPCDTQLREASVDDAVAYRDAQRSSRDARARALVTTPLAEAYPLRHLQLPPVRGPLRIVYGVVVDLDARGPCTTNEPCRGAPEVRVSFDGDVD